MPPKAFAGGKLHDDVCILLARVTSVTERKIERQ
jgi:hypothetical protein